MSSLYGNRFMEFKKFFYRFFFKNTGKNISTFDDASFDEDNILNEQGIELEPTDIHDSLTIETANKWIQMKEGNEPAHIALFHAKSDIGHEEIIDGQIYDKDGKPSSKTDLQFNDTITLYDLKFDAAGHIAQITPHTYTIPDLSYTTLSQEQLNELFNQLKL